MNERMQECTFQPASVSERMAGQGRALKLAGTLAHFPAPADYPDSPESHKYLVGLFLSLLLFLLLLLLLLPLPLPLPLLSLPLPLLSQPLPLPPAVKALALYPTPLLPL